jgi:REP element-mobilizing transposase RayT
MGHSDANLLYHIVFSTKNRHPWLEATLTPRLFEYMGGVVRAEGGILLAINGMPDHNHILAKLRQDQAVSEVVRAIKANSSGWVHRTFPDLESFHWQTGYGVFSVSHSQVKTVRQYIANQETHHATMTFQDEFRKFLRKHGIEFDEQDVWD